MKKRFKLTIILMVMAVFALGTITVSAEREGIYTYSVSNGEAKFTGCDNSVSGAITIPDKLGGCTVTSIGWGAFYGCNGLTSVTIPDSVKSIGEYVFYDCTGLTSITIPDSVTSIGEYAFEYCTGLTSITIPDSVTTIGEDAFYGCTGLTEVNITNIAAWCNIDFNICYSNPLFFAKKLYLNGKLVTDLVITDGVTSIGEYAFYLCTGLMSVTIPDSVKSIGGGAFYGCTGLTSITIPDSVETIDNSAFYGCTGLTSITIPDSVTSIGYSAFSGCDGLTSVTIPDSVETIGKYAFYGCTGLTSITIPDSVTSIGNSAFRECTGLTSVMIPDSVTSIGNSAFEECTGLASVTISGPEIVPEYMFYGCSNLKYVGLSDKVKYIKKDAFNSCSAIDTVYYEGSASEWDEIAFYPRNDYLINANIVYNTEKRTYSFETNCGEVLPDICGYAVFASPTVKSSEKTLIGWYDNASLSGEPVTFPYYGKATTLYAAWTEKTGKTFDDALVGKENKEYTVTIAESGQMIYYEFVPKYTGEYRFYSTGSLDTYGYLYNSGRRQITYNNNSGNGNNFYIEYDLTAGNTYYIGMKLYSGTGTFTFHIETDCAPGTKTVCLTPVNGNKIFMTIPSYIPENAEIILACYKDDRLTEVYSAPNKNETIYFVSYMEFDSAKIMVWESFGNMKPVCEFENVVRQ